MPDAADLKQHFTDAADISAAMAALLGDVTGLSVLEPAVGQGALLAALTDVPAAIDAFDIDPEVIAVARRRLAHLPLKARCGDFLALSDHLACDYDAVIANPPYGLHFSLEARRAMKSRWPDFNVRESYGLFFLEAVRRLRPGGRYVFLLPDSFLASRQHAGLRRFIAAEAAVTDIVRFPSRRFGTVGFGYGHLCLIAGHRAAMTPADTVKWRDVFNDQPLLDAAPVMLRHLPQTVATGWHAVATDLPEGWRRLGEIAECRTGIYTGDNPRFLGFDPARVLTRRNGHPIDWERDVGAGYVPLIRGGHRAFDAAPDWAIRWDAAALAHYRSDRKARFQNSGYYFRAGLAVPMVTSRRLSASLMQDAVFDQGVVGVFPHDQALRPALLLYLNSEAATRWRDRLAGSSANASANYLKRLPVPHFDAEAMRRARDIVDEALRAGDLPRAVCDRFVAAVALC